MMEPQAHTPKELCLGTMALNESLNVVSRGGSFFWVALYICISSSMLIINKAAMKVLPYPYFVTNLQVSARPPPAPLTALIADGSKRFGDLRVAAAGLRRVP